MVTDAAHSCSEFLVWIDSIPPNRFQTADSQLRGCELYVSNPTNRSPAVWYAVCIALPWQRACIQMVMQREMCVFMFDPDSLPSLFYCAGTEQSVGVYLTEDSVFLHFRGQCETRMYLNPVLCVPLWELAALMCSCIDQYPPPSCFSSVFTAAEVFTVINVFILVALRLNNLLTEAGGTRLVRLVQKKSDDTFNALFYARLKRKV